MGSAIAVPAVAVVPFGARDAADSGVARSLARRLVERLANESALRLEPVLVLAMPKDGEGPSYLVLGATPDVALAARFASSLDCTHALTGELGSEGLTLTLIDAAAQRPIATERVALAPSGLTGLEREAAQWLALQLGVEIANVARTTENEEAYRAHLEALDAEIDATLLRDSPERAAAERARSLTLHARAAGLDPGFAQAEERVLALAAASIELGEERSAIAALEELTEAVPRSWRAQFLLGELRRTVGDTSGAVVALEHAHSLHPLGDLDRVRLAELYLRSGAPGQAAAHLRGVARPGATGEGVARARRLLLGMRQPDLERDLEAAGQIAVRAEVDRFAEADAALTRVIASEPELWEAHFGRGLLARQRGDAVAAEEAFRRVLAIWPEQPDALHELGVALLMVQRMSEATSALDGAADLRPDDAGYVADSGFAHLRHGDLAGARERLERARTLDAADPITAAYIAELERVEAEGR